ncbi:MAG TPA: CDP-glucose 4,6-dehydratase [Bacteroidales bacterium]|nr:CDP-glucose 4,6-dehydratase [Bacteroidales bacterium]
MEMMRLFGGAYKGKRVLITGHTGFKGSWLAFWLNKMGAQVSGISLEPESKPNHISLIGMPADFHIHDINDRSGLAELVRQINPEVVFHLAAQALVKRSYQDAPGTYLTNVVGTANILDACRDLPDLLAIVVITTDKCYDNREWVWAYRETDALGGKDPYSASKACAELVVASYRHAWFNPDQYGANHKVLVATARAGNVIGGGDWAEDRIIPDLIRASVRGSALMLRYPKATRPWQHVLEPLSGYLLLGWRLLEGRKEMAEAWNFGPEPESNVQVIKLVEEALSHWPRVSFAFDENPHHHEAGMLMLDSTKAKHNLEWRNVWSFTDTVKHTIQWYKRYYEAGEINTFQDLEQYVIESERKNLIWTK